MNKKEIATFETSVIRHNPKKYGKNHTDYPKRAAEICLAVVEKLKKTPKNTEELKALFPKLLDYLGDERFAIARHMKTVNAYHFGLRRDNLEAFLPIFTPLNHEYRASGEGVRDKALQIFEEENGIREDHLTRVEVRKISRDELKEKGFLELNPEFFSLLKSELLAEHDVADCLPPMTRDEVEKSFGLDALSGKPEGSFYKDHQLKEPILAPDIYEHHSWRSILHSYHSTTFRSMLEEYVLVDLQYNFSGQWLSTSRFVLGKSSIGTYMQPSLLHMDPPVLPKAVESLGELFVKLFTVEEEAFLETMAHFEYLFSLSAVYMRGSASIREILTKAIYKCRGYKLVPYIKYETVDLVVFKSFLLSEFSEHYLNCFEKSPLKK